MALKPGSRLLHYELVEQIGEGGMGVVWKAEDTKLHREVAIKVLPADVASSPERLERFEREAIAVAALNHPNIVTIFGIEESAGHRFIAMLSPQDHPCPSVHIGVQSTRSTRSTRREKKKADGETPDLQGFFVAWEADALPTELFPHCSIA